MFKSAHVYQNYQKDRDEAKMIYYSSEERVDFEVCAGSFAAPFLMINCVIVMSCCVIAFNVLLYLYNLNKTWRYIKTNLH